MVLSQTQQLLAENTEKTTPLDAILDQKHSKGNALKVL
jgi:hypothetical protein